MTWFDKGFLAVYFFAIILLQCIWQHRLFKANKPISHRWHTLYYVFTILPMLYFFQVFIWQVIVIAVLERLALFDVTLNAVRNKRPLLTYNGKGTTGSKIDQWENRFSNTWLAVLKVTYIILFIVILLILK